MTREQWLQDATKALRPHIEAAGLTLPDVQVSVGWPSKKATAAKNRTLGQCWPVTSAADGVPHVFISPTLSDPVDILAVLVHELIHAAGIRGHKKDFAAPAKRLGLEGKMSATRAGAALAERLNALAKVLGPFKHGALSPTSGTKKQTTRLLKVSCAPCDYVVRVTRRTLDRHGPPICPGCTETMLEE